MCAVSFTCAVFVSDRSPPCVLYPLHVQFSFQTEALHACCIPYMCGFRFRQKPSIRAVSLTCAVFVSDRSPPCVLYPLHVRFSFQIEALHPCCIPYICSFRFRQKPSIRAVSLTCAVFVSDRSPHKQLPHTKIWAYLPTTSTAAANTGTANGKFSGLLPGFRYGTIFPLLPVSLT